MLHECHHWPDGGDGAGYHQQYGNRSVVGRDHEVCCGAGEFHTHMSRVT